MACPHLMDFPSAAVAFGACYRVTDRVNLVAFPIEASLPNAPDGFFVYAFVEGDQVGRWEWTTDPDVLRQVMEAFRETTSPDYEPPTWEAPDGDPPMIRPPIADMVARAMEAGRPGAGDSSHPSWMVETLRIDEKGGEKRGPPRLD